MNEEQNIKQLPEGWKWATIPDIVGKEGIFVDGDWIESKDQDPNGDIRLIQLADIGDGNFRNKSSRYLTAKRAKELNCTFLLEGDILVARMPDPIGRACIFPLKGKSKFVTAVDVAIIRPEQEIVDTKFLLYSINNPKYRNSIENLQSGTTRKRISRKNLSILDFPLPPLSTQTAIVSKIEELFSELDKGIENLRLAQQQLKTYRQSVLKWAFEGKLTNENVKDGELPEGWSTVLITDLAEKNKHALKAGPFGSTLKKEFYVAKGYKIYGQEQVINDDAFYGNYYINEEKYQELISCKIKPNDILISLVGTVGKVLLLPENCRPGIINPRLIKISLDKNVYLPKFFKYYFESSFVKSFYKAETRGTTMDVLNLGIIKTIPFPLCSTDEQNKIIQEIESRHSVADKIEENITQSLQQAEALRQSILKQAFEGKLVLKDPNINSATDEQSVAPSAAKEGKIVKMVPEEFPRKIASITQTDLHAGIIAMIIDAHVNNPKYLDNLSHVKCEKIAHLVEQKIGVSLGRVPVKDAAGPDDYSHLKKVEHRAVKAGYFKTVPLPIGHTYSPLKNLNTIIEKTKAALPEKEFNEIEHLIKLFLPFELEHAELVATIYAGWNNLLLTGLNPTDEDIVYESRENWSERKLTIKRPKFFNTLQWMKNHDFVPKGMGVMVPLPTAKTNKSKKAKRNR